MAESCPLYASIPRRQSGFGLERDLLRYFALFCLFSNATESNRSLRQPVCHHILKRDMSSIKVALSWRQIPASIDMSELISGVWWGISIGAQSRGEDRVRLAWSKIDLETPRVLHNVRVASWAIATILEADCTFVWLLPRNTRRSDLRWPHHVLLSFMGKPTVVEDNVRVTTRAISWIVYIGRVGRARHACLDMRMWVFTRLGSAFDLLVWIKASR